MVNEQKKIATQNGKIRFLEDQISQLKTNLVSLQKNNLSLSAQLSDLQKENKKLQQIEQLNKDLSQKIIDLEDELVQNQSDFLREKGKVNGYEVDLKTELSFDDVTKWKDAINSLKSRPEQAMLDAANAKLTTYENGLKNIFSGETIVKDAIVTKVIPTTSEPSQAILNIDVWMKETSDKFNNSQLKTELQQAKQELYGCKSRLIGEKERILQKFITQLELKLKGEQITNTKVIQAIKELLGKTSSKEVLLQSENKDQENQITNLSKILVGTKDKSTKINKENTHLTIKNKQLQSQLLSQKEKEKLLGIILGVESGVVLTFVILSLMFKKKVRKQSKIYQ